MIKPHHRAVGFGLGVALVSTCAARIGTSFHWKLARFGDFHTAVTAVLPLLGMVAAWTAIWRSLQPGRWLRPICRDQQ